MNDNGDLFNTNFKIDTNYDSDSSDGIVGTRRASANFESANVLREKTPSDYKRMYGNVELMNVCISNRNSLPKLGISELSSQMYAYVGK